MLKHIDNRDVLQPSLTRSTRHDSPAAVPEPYRIGGATPCPCAGFCPRCTPASMKTRGWVISNPDSSEERHAEQIADKLDNLHHGDPRKRTMQTQPRKPIEKTPRPSTSLQSTAPVHLRNAIATPGKPLNTDELNRFESHLGANLENVRLHTGPFATLSAKLMGAEAYTLGTDIVLGNTLSHGVHSTQHLLAHELAHVASTDDKTRTIYRSPAETPLSREEFTEAVKQFGVAAVRTGTKQDHNLGIADDQFPASWASWDPGGHSRVYNAVIDAFEAFLGAFGGSSQVSEIVFLPVHYWRDGNRIKQNLDAVAKFQGGTSGSSSHNRLVIYKTILNAHAALPIARSEEGVNYPVTASYDDGPGIRAPVKRPATQQVSWERFVLHELGHGIRYAVSREDIGNNIHPALLDDFKRQLCWIDIQGTETLYDADSPQVKTALQRGDVPPSEYLINEVNWNQAKWIDQPLSKYAVEGGPSEDLAETIMAYVVDEQLVATRSPLRYAFITSNKKRWQTGLVTPAPKADPETPP